MRIRVSLVAILVVCAVAFSYAQVPLEQPPVHPRIVIHIPENVRSESVWIRYSIRGQGGRIDFVKPVPNVREYAIDATYAGEPAQSANIIVYEPGCQFKTYSIELAGAADISEAFLCNPLPTKMIHGVVAPSEIPRAWIAAEKPFEIAAYLDSDWTCEYLMTQKLADGFIIAGSCLGLEIPLGSVAEIDPAKNGKIEIAIPDFTKDPLFADYRTRPSSFGVIHLALREKATERLRGGIRPRDASQYRGLPIQASYGDPVVFNVH